MINLKNKICLVTGSNGYIGKSICKKLKNLGAKVLETDFKNAKKKSKQFALADLNNEKDLKHLYDSVKKYKKIDVLVNNHGYLAADEINKNIFYNNEYIKLNLDATIKLTEKLLPLLKNSKSASIINISSIYGFMAYDKSLYIGTNMVAPIAYGVSKGGLTQFSKLLASKFGPRIRVNTLSPGGVFRNQPKKFLKRYISKTPLKRLADENEIADGVVFLASDLSSYITGHNLVIDGGYSIT